MEPEAEILKRKKSGGIPRGSVSVHVVPAVPVGKCVMTPYTSQPGGCHAQQIHLGCQS